MDVPDLKFLRSRAGRQAIIDTHVEGISEPLSSYTRHPQTFKAPKE
jgi:hypothetical protein